MFRRIPSRYKKIALDNQMEAAGVDVYYDTRILGIYEEQGAVRGMRTLCGGKIQDIGCTVLIDGTSEEHLIRTGNLCLAGEAHGQQDVAVYQRPGIPFERMGALAGRISTAAMSTSIRMRSFPGRS